MPRMPSVAEQAEVIARTRDEPCGSTWEYVCTPESGDYLERIEVPGGWLYRCILDGALTMTFVRRPDV